jgi:hypothetical protein
VAERLGDLDRTIVEIDDVPAGTARPEDSNPRRGLEVDAKELPTVALAGPAAERRKRRGPGVAGAREGAGAQERRERVLLRGAIGDDLIEVRGAVLRRLGPRQQDPIAQELLDLLGRRPRVELAMVEQRRITAPVDLGSPVRRESRGRRRARPGPPLRCTAS